MLVAAERKIEQKTEELRIRASVFGECVGQELVTLAREYDVSPGKLMLVEKYAISTGDPVNVDVSEWLDKPVKEIMAATKENKKAAKGTDSAGNGNNANNGNGNGDVQATASPTATDDPASQNGNDKNSNGPKPSATPKDNTYLNGSNYDRDGEENGKQNWKHNGKQN
jgi:hypothetical protein